ncbi:MAG: efflux RND transporter permease subunit, partial [Flavobacteriales bacterium]|nr:efflux RND transporter permease subunit [Flavobacteriales bacterium]
VLPAVTSAVATTIVAFSTFYFLDGRLGDFGPDLAFVVISTLLFSLVEGILILPGHIGHSKALSGTIKKSRLVRGSERVMNYLKERIYAPSLRFSLKYPAVAMTIPFAMFLITIGGFGGSVIKATFFPPIEQDNIAISIEMPPGTRDYITEGVLNHLVTSARNVNEQLKADRADSLDVILNIEKIVGPKINQGQINVQLLNSEQRNMSVFEINQAMRRDVGVIPEVDKMLFGVATPFGKPVSVSLRSTNLEQLEAAKALLKDELENISDLSDVTDNDQRGIKEVNLELKDKAYLLGMNLMQVVGQVRQGFFGAEAQRLQRGIDEVRVWVRYGEEDRRSLSDLDNFLIRTPNGQEIPLKELATYTVDRGLIAINHLNGKREIRVEAELGNPEASVSVIQEEIAVNIMPEIINQYPAVQFSFEGQNKEAQKTGKSFKKVGPVILILMIFIIAFVFRSIPQALAVILLVPLGIVGVGWGHWFHGASVSLLSGFGIIALIGVMVNDSLVLITAFNGNLKRGMDFNDALLDAGLSRFRPIIMTSFTTVAGLAPLIFEKSFQAQFLIPMAIAIAYGLIMATYTTLMVLPVVLKVLNFVRVLIKWLWTGQKPTRTEVEPAVTELIYENEI